MEVQKPVKIKAVAMWASTKKVNDLSGKFQIELTNLSDAAVKKLEDELGLEAQRKDEKGWYITCKSNHPIKAYDTDGDELDDLIGNGSEVTAVLGAYEWTFKKKTGKSPSLKKLTVTKLVTFNPDGDGDDDDDDEPL